MIGIIVPHRERYANKNKSPLWGFYKKMPYMACPDIDAEQVLQSFLWVTAMTMAESPTRT